MNRQYCVALGLALTILITSKAAEADSKMAVAMPETNVLFWNQSEREAGFPHMETLFSVHTVKI